MKSYEILNNMAAQLHMLDQIVEDADPASGISFMIRRGVARDNDEVEGDSERRPWTTIETSDLAQAREALMHIRHSLIHSITFFRKVVRDDINQAHKVLTDTEKVI